MASTNGKSAKLKDVEVTDAGIRITLGAKDSPYFVLFQKDGWDITDRYVFQRATDLDALRMVIERALDWNVIDSQGQPIPFDRDVLLAKLDQMKQYSPIEQAQQILATANLLVALWVVDPASEEIPPLADKIRALQNVPVVDRSQMLRLAMPLESPLIGAWHKAIDAARSLPLPLSLSAGAPEAVSPPVLSLS